MLLALVLCHVLQHQTHCVCLQFALWATAKSPLLISTDLSKISDASLAILKNQRIIDINVCLYDC
jgi:hypothetical protein